MSITALTEERLRQTHSECSVVGALLGRDSKCVLLVMICYQIIMRQPISVLGQWRRILEHFLLLIKAKAFFHIVKIKHISSTLLPNYLYRITKKIFYFFSLLLFSYVKRLENSRLISRMSLNYPFIYMKLPRKLLRKPWHYRRWKKWAFIQAGHFYSNECAWYPAKQKACGSLYCLWACKIPLLFSFNLLYLRL